MTDKEDFEKYCKETTIPAVISVPLLLVVLIIIFMVLGDCFHG